ncbi:ABC transporter permease [Ekhidna sp.]|uniref:ABC transporter permease n=1 Tax=Ekhidna sp. TaxID=2608089 RepID=UPI003298FE21
MKRKLFTLINSLGLSVGLTSCILITLFVINQYSYDKFFSNADQIYRMVEHRISPEGVEINSHVPYSFVGTVLNDYPEIESATAIAGPFPNQRISLLDNEGLKVNFLESGVLLADSNFFKVFSFKMITGNGESALKRPNSIVLTESTALKFFGSLDLVGKPITVSGRSSIVTGVCQDPPVNSHFKFSYLVSSTSVRWFSQDQFNLRYAKCYFKLHFNADSEKLEAKFPEMVDTYLASEIERVNNVTWKEYQQAGNGYNYFLRPLTSIHLDSEIDGGMKARGNPTMLKVLVAVAFLIFLIACINFMNLSTARSLERVREVGIRKVLGSAKYQLIFKFLIESFIISFVGVLLAVVSALLLIPTFNSLFHSAIVFPFTISAFIILLSATIIIGLLAGLYPAFVLSCFKPVNALKGYFFTKKGSWTKKGLVGFQFWISILLVICTLIFQKQIDFLENKNLGFDKDQLLVIEGTFHMDANYTRPFLEEASTIPGVKGTAGTLWVQGFQGTWFDKYTIGSVPTTHSLRRVIIGDQVAELMDFELVDGSFFSKQSNDEQSVLLNQAAVDAFGMEDPVGETISMLEHDEGALEKVPFKVKGVIRNFNYQSLHNKIEPLVLLSNEAFAGRMSYILIKLEGQNIKQTIEILEEKWGDLIPDRSFTFRFMDDTLEANYRNEKTIVTIFSIFSGISIFIAGIGLLALSAFTISLRTKEIGIRKVIGASVTSILLLLSKDFVKIIALAFLFAIPVAWFAMEYWLQDFAYRINISADSFIISGGIGLVISWVTISSQAIKAALTNPIDSLKDD